MGNKVFPFKALCPKLHQCICCDTADDDISQWLFPYWASGQQILHRTAFTGENQSELLPVPRPGGQPKKAMGTEGVQRAAESKTLLCFLYVVKRSD